MKMFFFCFGIFGIGGGLYLSRYNILRYALRKLLEKIFRIIF